MIRRLIITLPARWVKLWFVKTSFRKYFSESTQSYEGNPQWRSLFVSDSSLHQVDNTNQYIFIFLRDFSRLWEPNILFIKWNIYFVEIILSLVFFFNCFLGSFYYLSWYAVHLTHDYSQYIIHFKIPGLKNPNISALCLLIFFKLPVDFYLSFSLHCNVFYTQRRGTRLKECLEINL